MAHHRDHCDVLCLARRHGHDLLLAQLLGDGIPIKEEEDTACTLVCVNVADHVSIAVVDQLCLPSSRLV
jgi:hypothetical protein